MAQKKFGVFGNFCLDIFPGGSRPGGGALYAGVAAARLGYDSFVVTNYADDFLELGPDLSGISVVRQSHGSTTAFSLSYSGGSRRIALVRPGEMLRLDGLEEVISNASILMFAPVAAEYGAEFVEGAVKLNPQALMIAAPQGWMRKLREGAKVKTKAWDSAGRILPYTDILVVSDEDIAFKDGLLQQYSAIIGSRKSGRGVVVCTHGSRGATTYFGGRSYFVPAFKANSIDPTGAGDVFAAAFVISYCESKSIESSLMFAHSAAAFAIEGLGVSGIAERRLVEKRAGMARHVRKRFL